jgi:hypothetical protein
MTDIQIKTETMSQRCEVCHQADCFDPATNHCSRCAQSAALIKLQNTSATAPGKLTLDLQIDLNDFTKAQNSLSTLNSPGRQILFWIIIIGGALFLYTLFHTPSPTPPIPPPDDTGSSNGWVNIALICVPLLFLISLFITWVLYTKKKNAAFIKNEYTNMRCTFGSDGYELSSDKIYAQTKWQALTKVAESETYFIFYSDSVMRLVVPKRLLSGQHEIVILRDLIKSGLGDKAKLLAVNS